MSNKAPVTDKGKMMQIQPAEKTQPKTEREKLAEMRFKDKISYIWGYYKYFFIGGAIVLALAISLLNTFVFNPARKPYVSIATFGGYLPWETCSEIAEDLTLRFVPDTERFQVYLESYYLVEEDPQMNNAMMQKLMANVSVAELDVMIVSKEHMDTFLLQGLFAPVESVLPTNIITAQADNMYNARGMIYSDETKQETTVMANFGIRLAGNAYLESFGIRTDDLILAVVANSNRTEAAIECVRSFLTE